jgi:homoserine/homoserine lactone efflux protein
MLVDWTLIALFLPTAFFISVTPGMCMTLALTLGLSIGYKRTLWMMAGELLGVACVMVAAVVGMAAVMLRYPDAFTVFKWCGGTYLIWLGVQMWQSRGRMALSLEPMQCGLPNTTLAVQGFVTAVANPKGWAFFATLLPPFLSPTHPLPSQIAVLVAVFLVVEFFCLTLYAAGGKTLRHVLQKSGNVRIMNRVAGTLMMAVGLWLALG